MTRYELHCKRCNQVLGYMTYPGSPNATEILNATQVYGEYFEILCPTCEVKRLRGGKNEQ